MVIRVGGVATGDGGARWTYRIAITTGEHAVWLDRLQGS